MSFFGTIYTDEELSHRAKSVYMYLRDRSDAEGKCWPGIKTIASDRGLSRFTVKRSPQKGAVPAKGGLRSQAEPRDGSW